jgi:hypothetical protein
MQSGIPAAFPFCNYVTYHVVPLVDYVTCHVGCQGEPVTGLPVIAFALRSVRDHSQAATTRKELPCPTRL